MCDCTPVPRRMLEFEMATKSQRAHNEHGDQVVIAHQDGLGCPRCDSFTPTGPRVERPR